MSFFVQGKAGVFGTAMDSVLLVCNTNSSDSVAVANYYVLNRPGAGVVDVLPIATLTSEQISYAQMKTDIKAPIAAWMAANPGKPKKYVILCLGIPTRCTSGPGSQPVSVAYAVSTLRSDASIGAGPQCVSEYAGSGGTNGSGQTFYGGNGGQFNTHFTTASFPNTQVLVLNLCMGNTLSAVTTYIDKIAAMYKAMSSPNVTVSARGASLGGTNFLIDDTNTIVSGMLSPTATSLSSDGASATYSTSTVLSGSDLAAYASWGVHNSGLSFGDYPYNKLSFTGKSSWYVVYTAESFNGDIGGNQGDYTQWWNAGALGGSNSSRTPVGMCCHTEEPLTSGIEADSFFRNWFAGFNFAECAWSSRSIAFFMAVGDPLVSW